MSFFILKQIESALYQFVRWTDGAGYQSQGLVEAVVPGDLQGILQDREAWSLSAQAIENVPVWERNQKEWGL